MAFDQTLGDLDLFLFNAEREPLADSQHFGWRIDRVEVFATGEHEPLVTIGENTDNVNFANQVEGGVTGIGTQGSITGMLFNDRNRNGEMDEGEEPLSDYEVWLDRNQNGEPETGEVQLVDEDDGGVYEFTGLGPSEYRVQLLGYPDDVEPTLPTITNQFGRREQRVTGGSPVAVVQADLNGDRFPDFVVAKPQDNQVTYTLGQTDGQGTASDIVASSPPFFYAEPTAVAVGNLDNANGPDIVFANLALGGVGIALSNGPGSYAATPSALVNGLSHEAVAITTADVYPNISGTK